jgi:hypothetical protein
VTARLPRGAKVVPLTGVLSGSVQEISKAGVVGFSVRGTGLTFQWTSEGTTWRRPTADEVRK